MGTGLFVISRRMLLRAGAVGTGLFLGGAHWSLAHADEGGIQTAEPRPLPETITVLGVAIHHQPPAPGNDPSQITDFKGVVGNSRVTGMGTGVNTTTGVSTRLSFQADMGFMKGVFVGLDGRMHQGAFCFV